ncbi:hypothetical protein PENSPDRAFT_751760 [Peniophora sp. CONT]|nr:hypothetical protein PENSPDRAFT_751760 [Peniophora sp. CONT]
MNGTAALGVGLRPTVVRRDTEAILSYYQSEFADSGKDYSTDYWDADTPVLSATGHRRTTSTSSSSSLYSTPATPPPVPDAPLPHHQDSISFSGSHRRRPSNLSAHSHEDNRRMAIVQNNTDRFLALDGRSRSGGPGGASSSNKLKKKSGHVRGATISNAPSLASSAPHQRSMSDPDAFPNAPTISARPSRDQLAALATKARAREEPGEETPRMAAQHHLLLSTAGPPPPPPRLNSIDAASPPPPRPPRLRSPSPMVPRPGSTEGTPTSIAQALSTRTSASSLRPHPSDGAPHSDPHLSPVDEKEPSANFTPVSHAEHERSSHHVREGAFMPSRIMVTPPEHREFPSQETVRLVHSPSDYLPLAAPERTTSTTAAIDGLPTTLDASGLPPLSLHLPRPELNRDNSWVSVQIPSDPPSEYSSELSMNFEPPAPYTPDVEYEPEPTGPLANGAAPGLRSRKEGAEPSRPSGLSSADKRNSTLPRPPSVSTARTPSPPLTPRTPPVRRKKISAWPDAMWCRDVMSQRTCLERAIGYAAKINELAEYDCGLSDWITSVHARRTKSDRGLSTSSSKPAYTAMQVNQPRQVSRASISSEATFPMRPDAWTAHDLMTRPSDTVSAAPPPLPYPALAAATASTPPASNNRLSFAPLPGGSAARTLPAHVGRTGPASNHGHGGGFFASLGRNHSLKKDERTLLPPPQQPREPTRLIKAPPRPVQVQSAPTVPGGPRAAPHRMSRSQTLMLPAPVSSGNMSAPESAPANKTTHQPQMRRRSNTLKRPSLFGGTRDRDRDRASGSGGQSPASVRSQSHANPSPSPERDPVLAADFQAQVDKLADIIPHADREVLAGYLRRAGQDILAIGQYLEDEKNGTVRRS